MKSTALFSLCLAISTIAFAQDARPDALATLQGQSEVQAEDLLGGTFQNPLAGIAFRTPVNCVQVKSTGDEIARFQNEKAGWELIATRNSSGQPLPLSTGIDPREQQGAFARWQKASDDAKKEGRTFDEKPPVMKEAGLLEVIAVQLANRSPGIEIVRQDVVNLGENEAGIINARLSVGNQRRLLQQALIQANDQLYYTLSMTTPAAKDAKGADGDDPGERIAAESFRQMLDTVKLLDRGAIKNDQNERLYRTRAFFVILTPKKLRDTLVPETWMRLMRDGKDVGYTYIVEEPDDAGGGDGVKIGIRSRSYPDADTQVDGESWFIVTGDRKHENWSNLVWIQNLKTRSSDQITEMGSSDRRMSRVFDDSKTLAVGDDKDPKQPPVRVQETYELNVRTVGMSASAEPIQRSLPPFYLPQAIGHLLPRLLPLREPKTFLFATYVGDRREVMMRYVDVGSEQRVELGGEKMLAVPITDRIGLEGSPTIHYISPEGRYLGSVNKESKITILPSDAASLQAIWANRADLSRPRPAPAGPQPQSQSQSQPQAK